MVRTKADCSAAKTHKSGGGNPYNPQPTPEWQKEITKFFPGKTAKENNTENKFEKTEGGLFLHQENYARKILYHNAVGSLLYLSSKTRPDIAYSVNYASRKVENPTTMDIANVKRTLRYIQDTKKTGIFYKKIKDEERNEKYKLTAYCDVISRMEKAHQYTSLCTMKHQ
ncbi:hypothetical protein J437_LFUL010253 [Ladona fulva]|uniref:PCNA-associated factor histone-like domain-containing protein n=1 Tax=Ladona fulva TaxID=123851 RepID=A0A8K0K9W7_LADFU|nr:hypothetical protein J437_LFUL010253 [Ladona fulva]